MVTRKSLNELKVSMPTHLSSCPRGNAPAAPPHASSPDSVNNLDAALRSGHAAAKRDIELQKTTHLKEQVDMVYLDWDDIFVEDMLGVGGFASVYLVTCPKLRRKHGKTTTTTTTTKAIAISDGSSSMISFDYSWADLSEMSIDESEDITDAYALKCLSNRTMARPRQFITAAADLVGEAFLLSRLSHPNIIQLYGVTAGNVAQSFTKKGGYFLVLEALDTTLHDQLQLWRKTRVASMDDFFKKTQNQSAPSMDERLSILSEIAKGMEYLHSNDVIFRDLKPENVGFDRNGVVKLFDFGLAREIRHDHLPGIAGSVMYLSPESILQKFNCKASDVYSFGIVTWEVVSLLRPYQEFQHPDDLKKAVAIGNLRPDIGAIKNHPVKTLIENCWRMDYTTRPTFRQIFRTLCAFRGTDKSRRTQTTANI